MKKETRLLRVGVLGCGPIAQFAHFDACRKARNAELYAICDVAEELTAKAAAVHEPRKVYHDFDHMLADPQVEAVIIATADQYHVPLCQQAMAAGKHVLVEKPLGVSIEECESLRRVLSETQLVLQVGHNRRFDPGVAFVRHFVTEQIGQRIGFKAWYYDSTYRYTMTDNLQPIPLASKNMQRPAGDPKADKRRYFMLTHGSHLVDTTRFLGGEIASVQARLLERCNTYCWFISVDFADGSLGQLDLTIAVRGDFEEAFQLYGEHGSACGKLYLPWHHKSSYVECFSTKDRQFRRPLGEDAYTYKLQIEGFADTILHGKPLQGAGIDDGVASMRAMVAIARSVEDWPTCAAARCRGRHLVHLGIFAKIFPRPTLEATFQAVSSHGLNYVQFNMACAGLPTLPDRVDPDLCRRIRDAARQYRCHDFRGLRHVQHDPPGSAATPTRPAETRHFRCGLP